MAKKVEGYIKLQIPAGKATPAPPVGPALGQHGVNIVEFTNSLMQNSRYGRYNRSCSYHCLRRQKLQLHYKNSSSSSTAEKGLQLKECICNSKQDKSCKDF